MHGNPLAEDELHIAIAHWIAAHCLPFSMAEDELFKRILAKARATNQQGQRARLGVVRTKKQSAILAACIHEKSALRKLAASKAGMLYEDADFDQFLGEGFWEDRKRLATQIFRAWYEGWEDAQLNSAGDDRFAAELSVKYGD